MKSITPQKFVLKSGVGVGIEKMSAFDRALLEADVSDYNLIKVSSILPPQCMHYCDIDLKKGSLLPSAYASCFSDQVGETIAAAVAVGIPVDSDDIGVIMEYSGKISQELAEAKVRELVREAMDRRNICIKSISSTAVECKIEKSQMHCVFATVSMW